MTWAPQRHKFIFGVLDFHVKSLIARWIQETQTSIRRWCFTRLGVAVQHAQNRRNICDLWQKQRLRKCKGAITSAWRSFALQCRVARGHLRKKATFDLKQTCAQCFRLWRQSVQTSHDFQMKAEMKQRFNLLHVHLHRWRKHAVSRILFAASRSRRTTAFRLRCLSCFLRKWSIWTKRAIHLTRCSGRLSCFCQKLLMRRSFHCWLLRLKQLLLLRLNKQVGLQDQAASSCASCIARFWLNRYRLLCFRNWADFSKNVSSRNCSVVKRSAAKKLHLVFRTWLNVADYCRKRRWSCSLLVVRRRHLIQRIVYYAWAVSARRTAHARIWLEALCVRWRDSFLLRRMCSIMTTWRSYVRSCRLSRFKVQQSTRRLLTQSSALKRRAMNCWRSFKIAAAKKQHRFNAGQGMLQRNFHTSMRCLLSKWLQHSKLRQQKRTLMQSLNRTCDRILQSKNHDTTQSNFTKWHKCTVQRRARRACCVRVELIVQVRFA
jgi:hypothetical protein